MCAACGHPRQVHLADACRINGCRCEGFDDGRPKRPTGPRRIAIDIPDGFALQLILTPVSEAADDEDATAAIASVEETRP